MSLDDAYVDVRDLHVDYRDPASPSGVLTVFDGLSVQVSEHGFVGVVGPNGCGKTTLLLTIAGLLAPKSGVILVDGTPPRQSVCGFVFQNYRESLFPWLTVLDNIAIGLTLARTSRAEARDKAKRLAERLGLTLPFDRYPYQLSGGQQQLTAILRAVIAQPRVVLLDEPLGSIDPAARQELRASLRRVFAEIRTTCLMVTHDVEDALDLADRVIVLSSRPARIRTDIVVPNVGPALDSIGDHRADIRRHVLDALAGGDLR